VTAGGARVDIARVAEEPAALAILGGLAAALGTRVLVADSGGRVVARFGAGPGAPPEALPADPAGAAAAGWILFPVEVYDAPCGFVAAPAEGAAAGRTAADAVAALATREYESESLSRNLLDVYEELNLFYGITARMHEVGSVDGICATILDRACEIVRAARASILLADPHTGVLRIAAARGISAEQAATVRVRPGEGVVGKVMRTGQAVVVDDARSLESGGRTADDRYASRSFISIPLRVFDPEELSGAAAGAASRRRPVGVLNMTDKADARPFTSGDMKLLSALASQAAVLLDNTRLAGIEKEIGLARTIQATLLPQSPPRIPGAELAGVCLPARNVGGDYYDLLSLPGGRACILVADVSGHNVGAALMMAVTRAALRAEIDRGDDPAEVLARANRLLDGDLARAELFVSVFVAIYDPPRRLLSWASAGHNPGMLLRSGASAPETLDAEGMLFGVLGDAAFERREATLADGDLLLLYTDGLTEARNPAGEMFGEPRLEAALAAAAARATAEVPRALIDAVDAHTGAAPDDDRTAVVLRACRIPPPAEGERP
jgi:sigma-B regulation protein RsbU (phosphoserine phosphatase)